MRRVLVLLGLVLYIQAQAQQPQLEAHEAWVDLDANELVIKGVNFDNGNALEITLGDVPLTVVPSVDPAMAATEIRAAMPALFSPGTYTVLITSGGGSIRYDQIDITVGNTGPRGPEGPPGPKGDPGATGAKGDTGERGPRGEAGDDCSVAQLGTPDDPLGATVTCGVAMATIPKGDRGEQGIPGPQGEQGQQGTQGLKGDQGPQGIPGTPGVSVFATTLPAGNANCQFGGTEFTSASGLNYACNGAPGEQGPPGTGSTSSGLVNELCYLYKQTGALPPPSLQSESPEQSCADNLDNDCNGLVDAADFACGVCPYDATISRSDPLCTAPSPSILLTALTINQGAMDSTIARWDAAGFDQALFECVGNLGNVGVPEATANEYCSQAVPLGRDFALGTTFVFIDGSVLITPFEASLPEIVSIATFLNGTCDGINWGEHYRRAVLSSIVDPLVPAYGELATTYFHIWTNFFYETTTFWDDLAHTSVATTTSATFSAQVWLPPGFTGSVSASRFEPPFLPNGSPTCSDPLSFP